MSNTLSLLAVVGCVLAAIFISPAQAADSARVNLGMDGRTKVTIGDDELCTLDPVMASPKWQFATAKMATYKQDGPERKFDLKLGNDLVTGQATISPQDGKAKALWTFTAGGAMDLACLAVSLDFDAAILAGGSWKADTKSGAFPAELGQVHLYNAEISSLSLKSNNGRSLTVSFPKPTLVLIQDNRQWTPSFSIRIGRQGTKLAKGERYELPMTLATVVPIAASTDGPVVIKAGEDWVPLKTELEIEPGSALDFSGMGFTDGPCGKQGWVVATPDGHFAFEKDVKTPRRFYGVNFCFDALYLPKDQVDKLTDRLLRLGYNTIRVHHYEGKLTDGKPGFDWNPQALDQLDYLMAACRKRGIYVTTDLYVSRPVGAQQIDMPGTKSWAREFKVMVPVHEPAFKDWETFTRKFLDRVNPHTGLRLADDPTLAWLAMINEGNFGNYWNEVKSIPQWKIAWNKWLAKRYADRASLAGSWGKELKADEDAAAGSVALPDSVYGDSLRHRDCVVFLNETERDMFVRMEKFLRNQIKCKALLTNMNAWTNHASTQLARQQFDYVDDHFYVDHPQFIERDWQLPSRCGNQNPVKQGAPGGRSGNCVRIFGKPFTVSEYNYSGPGRFRGVGGILTGAMAALQDWDVIWRFAYSHTNRTLFQPGPINYFDLVSDPLSQAADRAAVMLYLRGDLKTASHQVTMTMTPAELLNPPGKIPSLSEGPNWLAWVTRVGTELVDDPTKAPKDAINLPLGWSKTTQPQEAGLTAFNTDRAKLLATMKQRGFLPANNLTNPATNTYQSETGEMLLDAPKGVLRFDTDLTAGGYAEPGQSLISPKSGTQISDLSIGATVFITSVDGKPIKSSKRLLVTHLTDLQNTDATYAEAGRQTLLSWGKLPHLVRAGKAKVSLTLPDPEMWTVHVLATGGRRVAKVPTNVDNGHLVFTCDVRGDEGARMLYEVVTR